MNFEEAKKDLLEADKIIKSRHRYNCGLLPEEQKSSGDLFFESPDGQNGELFYELKNLGWKNRGYKAPYDWGVYKNGVRIAFTEGDVYIREHITN